MSPASITPNLPAWFTRRRRAAGAGLGAALSVLVLAAFAAPKQAPRKVAAASQGGGSPRGSLPTRRQPRATTAGSTASPTSSGVTQAPQPTPQAAQWFVLPTDPMSSRVLFRSPEPAAPLTADPARRTTALTPAAQATSQRPSKIPKATRVTVMLHGMCDVPDNECPSFSNATRSGWLVCPQASVGCQGGGATWHWKDRVGHVEAATARALQAKAVQPSARTLIGFSLGASAALDVAQHGSQRYDALILIAGRVSPNPRQLRAHGVKRVLLAAGDFDQTHAHLVGEARRLTRAGITARFMSLGKVGHQFAPDMDAWLREALSWAEADDDNQPP